MPTESERIKNTREALNLTQQQLAEEFGVKPAFISNVENNRKSLSKKHLRTLLVNYNVNINYLIAGIGEMFIEKE